MLLKLKSINFLMTYALLSGCFISYVSLPIDIPADPHPIRLMGGRTSTEGRVEIYYNGEWGTICDRHWDMDDANVACRSLGLPGAAAAPIGVCEIVQ